MEKKDGEEKPKVEPKSKPSSINKRRNTCCCLGIFIFLGLIVFLSSPLIRGIFYSADVPIPIPSGTTSNIATAPTAKPTSIKTSISYPSPAACNQVQVPSSTALDISPNNPGVKEKTDLHYYSIYGYTRNDLRAQQGQCGPKWAGESFGGMTTYYVNWIYNYRTSANSCGVKDAAVGVKVDITYPKWDTPEDYQQGLLQTWQSYIAALETHENGHGQNGIDAANDILNSISSLPSEATCDALTEAVNAKANDIMAIYSAKDKSYDDTTNHGETQGASF